MKRLEGTLKFNISCEFPPEKDETIENAIYDALSPVGDVDVTVQDGEAEGTVSVDATLTTWDSYWDENGGDPGGEDMQCDVNEDRIKDALKAIPQMEYVYVREGEFEAA